MKISCLGTGYVGLVTGACLADLGHEVICCDIDEKKIDVLRKGEIPFYEPGLKDVVERTVKRGNLHFTTDVEDSISKSEVIFNCVGTPSKEDGSANMQFVINVAENVAKYAKGHTVLINKSTVPPGTAKMTSDIVKVNSDVEVVSNPEFLKEGNAVHDFTHPDKIVVGAESDRAFAVLRQVYAGFLRPYLNLLETNWVTAEMIKYANNSFLATKISFINEIANICDKVGGDVKVVAKGLGMDYRISPKFLNAGIGYGGSCFPKDVRALIMVAKENGYEAQLLQEVNHLNERQKKFLLEKVISRFGSDLSSHQFTIWGLSFKPKTSDIREGPSLVLIDSLLELGATVTVYDPVAFDEVKENYGDRINYADSVASSVKHSSAILLVTEWDEFRSVDLSDLRGMKHQVLFDGRNIYQAELVRLAGFEYYCVGRQ